jgi:uncharacterized membrane protein
LASAPPVSGTVAGPRGSIAMPVGDEMPRVYALAELLARAIELAGVAAIVLGVAVSLLIFLAQAAARRSWSAAYDDLRSNLGRGILLGLELLVGADIITTITAPLTFESVGLLAAIVVIRTFLSFSLETEIEGRWPWRRAEAGQDRSEAG